MSYADSYCEMVDDWGMSSSEAARAIDYRIAYETAKRQLAKKGIRREPTEREVDAVLQSM